MSDKPRNFPDLIAAYLAFTRGHEATDRIHKWSWISCIAAALERKVYLPRGYYTLFPNLYVFIIGRSGLIKKSTSTAIAVSILREVETVKVMAERLTAGSLIQQIGNAWKRYETPDGKRMQQSALFAYASELAVFLQEVFGSITELLTTFYDCVPHDCNKPWVYNTIGRGEAKIFGPCLNLLGASTTTWLKRCIPTTEMEGGFSSRIIFVVENRIPTRLIAWPEVPKELSMQRVGLIEDLRRIHSLSGEMTVSEGAKAKFERWYKYHMTEILPMNSDPRMVGYMSRKGDTMLKLAMIRSVSLRDSLVIEEEDLVWGTEELEALEPAWRDAFDGVATKSIEELPFNLRNYIRKRVKVTPSEVLKVFGTQYPGNEVKKALGELIAMKEILEVSEPQKEGEPKRFFTFIGSDLNLV